MIALYKDPKGEKVFDKYETPSLKSHQQHTQRQQQHTCTDSSTETIDSLKKRIQELENIMLANQMQDQHQPTQVYKTSMQQYNDDCLYIPLGSRK